MVQSARALNAAIFDSAGGTKYSAMLKRAAALMAGGSLVQYLHVRFSKGLAVAFRERLTRHLTANYMVRRAKTWAEALGAEHAAAQ